MHLQFSTTLYQKRQVLERNIHLNLYVIQFIVVIVRHLIKQSVKAPGLLVPKSRRGHQCGFFPGPLCERGVCFSVFWSTGVVASALGLQ